MFVGLRNLRYFSFDTIFLKNCSSCLKKSNILCQNAGVPIGTISKWVRGGGGLASPIMVRQNWGLKGRKKFLVETGPPISKVLDDLAPPPNHPYLKVSGIRHCILHLWKIAGTLKQVWPSSLNAQLYQGLGSLKKASQQKLIWFLERARNRTEPTRASVVEVPSNWYNCHVIKVRLYDASFVRGCIVVMQLDSRPTSSPCRWLNMRKTFWQNWSCVICGSDYSFVGCYVDSNKPLSIKEIC